MSVFPYYRDYKHPFEMMEQFEKDFWCRSFFNTPFHQMIPRDFYDMDTWKPWDDFRRNWNLDPFKPFNFDQLTSAMNNLALQDIGSTVTADKEKFQINVDVQHFAPEEINVKVVDGEVMIEGKHEEKRDDHGYISRQFVRRYMLPQGCLPDTVESKLSSDGVLTVTAPTVLPLPSPGERIIPITHTGPVQTEKNSPVVPATVHEVK